MADLKKKHAEHNEKACDFLFKDGKYLDWVVTTAFYSALHFVQHEVFPRKIGLITYSSFENYYNGHFNNVKNKPNRHVATINLVFAEIGDDAGHLYKWLHDTCRTARYRNFNTPPDVAKLSKERLFELRTFMAK